VLEVEQKKVHVAPEPKLGTIPTIKCQIGQALPLIGNYTDLNNKEQVVALVDEDLCVNCGKCCMSLLCMMDKQLLKSRCSHNDFDLLLLGLVL
jgi:ferredoxin